MTSENGPDSDEQKIPLRALTQSHFIAENAACLLLVQVPHPPQRRTLVAEQPVVHPGRDVKSLVRFRARQFLVGIALLHVLHPIQPVLDPVVDPVLVVRLLKVVNRRWRCRGEPSFPCRGLLLAALGRALRIARSDCCARIPCPSSLGVALDRGRRLQGCRSSTATSPAGPTAPSLALVHVLGEEPVHVRGIPVSPNELLTQWTNGCRRIGSIPVLL